MQIAAERSDSTGMAILPDLVLSTGQMQASEEADGAMGEYELSWVEEEKVNRAEGRRREGYGIGIGVQASLSSDS